MDHYYAILNKITNEKNNYFFDVKPFTIKIIFFSNLKRLFTYFICKIIVQLTHITLHTLSLKF